MRSVLRRVGVQRCTDAEGAPEPTQCRSGGRVAAACGCGRSPPCHFTITRLKTAAGGLGLTLPGVDRKRQADLIAAALGLATTPPDKGMLGRPYGTRNYPVIGYRLGGEDEDDRVAFDLEHALNRLCGDGEDVRWGYGDGERLQLGSAVARTDPRYEGQSEHDAHAWDCYHGWGQYHEEDLDSDACCDVSGVEWIDEATPDDGAAAVPHDSPFAPYHRPASEAELTAASQRRWRQRRAIFDTMPEDMPADEQVQRVSLALDYSAAAVDALNTWNAYQEGTVASMLSEVAGEVGSEALGHQLASGILLRAAHGARLVGLADARASSAAIPTMMRVAKRVGVAAVESALRALVAPAAPAAPAALTAALDAASSSPAASAAHGPNKWTCQSCGYAENSASDEVCTNEVRAGQLCNSTRASAAAPSKKRHRAPTQLLNVSSGAGKAYESASGASSSSSGGSKAARPVAKKGAPAGSRRPGRDKAPPPDGEGDEDAPILRTVEALVQSPAEVEGEAGFVHYDELILSDDVRKWAGRHYIYPLQERVRGEDSEPLPGLLLTGPPGTGKTALAKAIAVSAGVAFLPIGNAKVLSQWAGKADRTMAAIFAVAKRRAPCIVFFDEADKLLQSTASGSADAHSNVTNGFSCSWPSRTPCLHADPQLQHLNPRP